MVQKNGNIMTQEETVKAYRIRKHNDMISNFNNPDHARDFEERNKELREVFAACGYNIGGIKIGVGGFLEISMGKYYNFRALSTDRYIILIDNYDYKNSRYKVQLVTDTDLKIKKIKPKIDSLITSVKERLGDHVVRSEKKEKNEVLIEAIKKELKEKKEYNVYGGSYSVHGGTGTENTDITVNYIKGLDDKITPTYHGEEKNRNMGASIDLKINRFSDAEHDYNIIDVEFKAHLWGAHEILGDYMEYINNASLDVIYAERMRIAMKRAQILMEKLRVMRHVTDKVLLEIEGYE